MNTISPTNHLPGSTASVFLASCIQGIQQNGIYSDPLGRWNTVTITIHNVFIAVLTVYIIPQSLHFGSFTAAAQYNHILGEYHSAKIHRKKLLLDLEESISNIKI